MKIRTDQRSGVVLITSRDTLDVLVSPCQGVPVQFSVVDSETLLVPSSERTHNRELPMQTRYRVPTTRAVAHLEP